MAKRLARGGRRDELHSPSILTRAVESVFDFVRFAEFEILFVLFFVAAYVIFKDLGSCKGLTTRVYCTQPYLAFLAEAVYKA
ncbi:hypothetical protein FXO37_35167 [Capsicum annuum]|nr:hypothetical protein FXO37_35167 [Capsicum annuum]